MSAFFIIGSAVLTVFVVAVIVALARRTTGAVHLARIVLPLAMFILLAQMALHHWSLAAFALLAAVIISAGALAVRGRGREHGPTWIALGVFATAGLAGGFGLLTQGLCDAGNGYNCGGTGPDVLAAVGWAIAFAAYAYLAAGALRT
ncbi:MAG: hypothetical protein WCN97_00310 [Thermoleophilia bacterium]